MLSPGSGVQNLTAETCSLTPAVGALRLRQWLASCDAEGLAVDVACLLGGEEDEGRGELGGLGWAAHRGGAAEAGDGVARHGGGDDRGPHRTWRNYICPQSVLDDFLGEPLGEGDDGAFCARVRKQRRRRLVGLDGGYVDNGSTLGHVRERRLHEPEHRVDVGLEGSVEQFGRDVGYPFDRHLVGRVVDEDVYPAELVHGLLDERLALALFGHVPGHLYGLAARVFDGPRRLFGIWLFLFEEGDHDIGALAGEGERDGPPDARVTAGYDRLLALELAAALVGLDAVVGLGGHILLEAGVPVHLGLHRILRLWILLGRVLLGVLVLCHRDRPSCSDRGAPRPLFAPFATICPFFPPVKREMLLLFVVRLPSLRPVLRPRIMGLCERRMDPHGRRLRWENTRPRSRTSPWTSVENSAVRRTTSSSAIGPRVSIPLLLQGRSCGRATRSSNASPTISSRCSSRTTRCGRIRRRGSTRTTRPSRSP